MLVITASKPILKSIIESFEEQGRVYCIVLIYDDIDIGVKAASLSKLDNIYLQGAAK